MIQRWQRCVFLLAILLIVVPTVFASEPSEAWVRLLDGPGTGALMDLCLTPEGQLLAVGATNHRHTPPYTGDAILLGLDTDGNLLWTRAWGGRGYEQAWRVLPSEDGYLVFGETSSYGAGDRDFFLLKTDAEGEEEWVQTYGTAQREWPYGLLQLAGGDLLLYGMTRANGHPDQGYAVRVTSSGEVVWEYQSNSLLDEIILGALETENGEVVLCLSIERDGGLLALSDLGDVLWSQRYQLAGWEFPSEILAYDEGYLLSGFIMNESSTQPQADVWFASVDFSGELQNTHVFGEPVHNDYAQFMTRLNDGSILIGGIGRGMPVFSLSDNAAVLWEYRLDDLGAFVAQAAVELEDGSIIICGMNEEIPMRRYSGILVRLDPP